MESPLGPARCPRCGAVLPPDRPEGLCPACVLGRATEPISSVTGAGPATSSKESGRSEPSSVVPRLAAGPFGPYRIERLLGRGGMGEVYEAIHLTQGRRVALKVLSERLANAADRAQFLREGQLAASFSDPHSVYIFGSEEIDGVPVIAMELLPGGTLKDRVRHDGPLPTATAIDAIRQVIAGLEAARQVGILHRDVKPSNCFVGSDGTVKVGDFGLSISTLAREGGPTSPRGAFYGTPQFAAPEQWRGEALDVRADIYAVGATLFYLLTGRPPVEDPQWRVSTASLAPLRPAPDFEGIAKPVVAVLRQCLRERPADRPQTYASLDKALRPFASSAQVPAALGRRMLAGCVDGAVLFAVTLPLYLRDFEEVFRVGRMPWHGWLLPVHLAVQLAYYTILEGRWGASVGKWACSLRVQRVDGQRLGLLRAAARTCVYELQYSIAIPGLLFMSARAERITAHPGWGLLVTESPLLCWFALFSTARRRNGFAGLHDLATGARVVQRAPPEASRPLAGAMAPPPVPIMSAETVGPFVITGALWRTDLGELLAAFDPALRRPVWIHRLPEGAPPLAPSLRDASRPAQLHWLTGERGVAASWDAYEALDGESLRDRLATRQPWDLVRGWLLDLAREIEAGLGDASLPSLTLDRIWITRQNRLKVLPFGAPGATPATAPPTPVTFASALTVVADALHASTRLGPLPLSAETVRERVTKGDVASPAALIAMLASPAARADRVTRIRRAASVALCGAPPALFALAVAVVTLYMRPVIGPMADLDFAMSRLTTLDNDTSPGARAERESLAIYIAAHWGSFIGDQTFWIGPSEPGTAGRLGRLPVPLPQTLLDRRPRAEEVLAQHPHVSSAELAAATAQLGSFINDLNQNHQETNDVLPWGAGLVTALIAFLPVPVFGTLWAFILRGGLFLGLLGIAVVTRDGRPAARWRTLWRAVAAWWLIPAACGVGIHFWGARLDHSVAIFLLLAGPVLFVIGAVWAIATPQRGLQDRLAGTWLVPR